jgi:hypothetical protein
LFAKQLTDEEVSTLVEGLKGGDYINVVGSKVSYRL